MPRAVAATTAAAAAAATADSTPHRPDEGV